MSDPPGSRSLTRRVSRRAALLLVVASGALVGAALLAGCGVLRAGRLLADALAPADTFAGEVEERAVDVAGETGALVVHVTRPRGAEGALPGVVLVHGAIAEGPLDPRMLAFARALAVNGATVASPDLTSLRRVRFDADDPARIRDAIRWLAERPELAAEGRVAVFAISVAGSYALLAAADPALEGRLSCALAFGSYADLETLLLQWLADPPPSPAETLALAEGRRKVLLGNLRGIVPPADALPLERALHALLASEPVPTDVDPAALSLMGRRALAAARSEEPLSRELAASLLEPLDDLLAALSPAAAARLRVPAPVFLLHGAADPVVATEHSRALLRHLRAAGTEVELHVTDLFEHVGAASPPSFWEALPLLRFVDGVLDAAGL